MKGKWWEKIITWNGVFNARDVGKVGGVRDTQATHAVSVSPFGKVTLEGFRSFVCVIATDFAIVADVETVQLVQPVRNRLQWICFLKNFITLCNSKIK